MNDAAGESTYKISASLYLCGDALDPAEVSRLLGKEPDRSQLRGEIQSGKQGRKYVRRVGLWILNANIQPDSSNLADYLDELLSKIDFDHAAISKISGLEDAYIDIFMARTREQSSYGDTIDYEITPNQLRELSRIGIPIRFTVVVVEP